MTYNSVLGYNSALAKWQNQNISATYARFRIYAPEEFGALGNGVADDTTAVRAAFAAANALVRSGLTGAIYDPGARAGMVVNNSACQTLDQYDEADLPVYRARNRVFGATTRPLFAAYPFDQNPAENPRGWTAALSDRGVLFAAAGTETGVIYVEAGALKYRGSSGTVTILGPA